MSANSVWLALECSQGQPFGREQTPASPSPLRQSSLLLEPLSTSSKYAGAGEYRGRAMPHSKHSHIAFAMPDRILGIGRFSLFAGLTHFVFWRVFFFWQRFVTNRVWAV